MDVEILTSITGQQYYFKTALRNLFYLTYFFFPSIVYAKYSHLLCCTKYTGKLDLSLNGDFSSDSTVSIKFNRIKSNHFEVNLIGVITGDNPAPIETSGRVNSNEIRHQG